MKKQALKELANVLGEDRLDKPLFDCPQWAKELPYDFGSRISIRAYNVLKCLGVSNLSDLAIYTPSQLLAAEKSGVVTVLNIVSEYDGFTAKLLNRVMTLAEAKEGISQEDACISIAYYSQVANAKVA